MARKKRRTTNRRRTAGRRKADNRRPGWVYMLLGLTLGLAVAFGVFVSGLKPSPELKSQAEEIAEVPAKAVAKIEATIEETIEEVEEPTVTFDFYDMLPNLDVEVYEDEAATKAAPRKPKPVPKTAPVTAPGIYILQAGSFSKFEDAQRRKAQMALLGVRAEIKRGNANSRTVYRVYTNPMENPAEVNRISKMLNDADIDVLRKRVSD